MSFDYVNFKPIYNVGDHCLCKHEDSSVPSTVKILAKMHPYYRVLLLDYDIVITVDSTKSTLIKVDQDWLDTCNLGK